jgi:hypothetical protein
LEEALDFRGRDGCDRAGWSGRGHEVFSIVERRQGGSFPQRAEDGRGVAW